MPEQDRPSTFSASVANSAMRRLLPTPASPCTITHRPSLRLASSRAKRRQAISTLSSDQRDVGGHRRRAARPAGRRSGGRWLDAGPVRPAYGAKDLQIELLRVRFRLHSELVLQDTDAQLILAKRGPPTAKPGVEAHERAVHGLLERIQRDQPSPGLQGGLHRPGGALQTEQPGQHLEGQLPQARPLGHQPLLERGLLPREPVEQVASIEIDRLDKRLWRTGGGELFEGHRVDVDGVGAQGDGGTLDAKASRASRLHGPPQGEERLPKAVPRMHMRQIPP